MLNLFIPFPLQYLFPFLVLVIKSMGSWESYTLSGDIHSVQLLQLTQRTKKAKGEKQEYKVRLFTYSIPAMSYKPKWHSSLQKILCIWEFPLWLRFKSLTSTHEDAGLIPGLTQGVKDPELLQDVAWVTDAAWIWCCCGYVVGRQLQL